MPAIEAKPTTMEAIREQLTDLTTGEYPKHYPANEDYVDAVTLLLRKYDEVRDALIQRIVDETRENE